MKNLYKAVWAFCLGCLFCLATTTSVSAFWTLTTNIDMDMDTKDDVRAKSKFVKQQFSQRADIYDSVTVLEDSPGALTKLAFDWKIDQGHQFKGALPWAGNWTATNHWYTYRYPFHADFTLELTPEGIGVDPFTRTAEAHQPHLVVDKILGLLAASVGGGYGIGDNTDTVSDFVAAVEVWAEFEDIGGSYSYKYWARNNTAGSAHLDWWAYTDPEIANEFPGASFSGISLSPGETKLLTSLVSFEDPLEINGRVTARFGGNEFIFFAPTIVPVPEPSSLAVIAGGVAYFGVVFRRRKS